MCRLRQIARVIDSRHKALRAHQHALVEWQTKTTVHFIAATVPTDKGKKNPLLESADKVKLEFEGDENAPALDNRSLEEVIEQGSLTALDKNKPGSFERLTRGLTGPR